MANSKVIWGYIVFNTNAEFVAWQATGEYVIQTVIPMDACECGTGEIQKVMVSYWK